MCVVYGHRFMGCSRNGCVVFNRVLPSSILQITTVVLRLADRILPSTEAHLGVVATDRKLNLMKDSYELIPTFVPICASEFMTTQRLG